LLLVIDPVTLEPIIRHLSQLLILRAETVNYIIVIGNIGDVLCLIDNRQDSRTEASRLSNSIELFVATKPSLSPQFDEDPLSCTVVRIQESF